MIARSRSDAASGRLFLLSVAVLALLGGPAARAELSIPNTRSPSVTEDDVLFAVRAIQRHEKLDRRACTAILASGAFGTFLVGAGLLGAWPVVPLAAVGMGSNSILAVWTSRQQGNVERAVEAFETVRGRGVADGAFAEAHRRLGRTRGSNVRRSAATHGGPSSSAVSNGAAGGSVAGAGVRR